MASAGMHAANPEKIAETRLPRIKMAWYSFSHSQFVFAGLIG